MTIALRLPAALALAVLALAAPARAASPLDTFNTAPASAGGSGFENGPKRAAVEDPVRFVLQVGADFGLSTALPLVYADGTKQDLKFNQGASVGVGLSGLSLAGGLLGTQATIGLEYSTVTGSNASVRWLTFPLEVMEVINLYPLRLGAGLSCLLAPTVKGDGDLSNIDRKYKTSLGLLLEGAFIFLNENNPRHPAWWIGVRYEINRVENSDTSVSDDANAVGVVLGGAM